jgi:hypothetical protein
MSNGIEMDCEKASKDSDWSVSLPPPHWNGFKGVFWLFTTDHVIGPNPSAQGPVPLKTMWYRPTPSAQATEDNALRQNNMHSLPIATEDNA